MTDNIFLTIFFAASCVLSFLYAYVLWRVIAGWKSIQPFTIPADYKPSVFLSVIIPARNEAQNIRACLDSILSQRYLPQLFEVIVIDDFSDDDTAKIVETFSDQRLKLLRLQDFFQPEELHAHKKKAIETGITHAKGELIVTTDADCIAGENWLATIAAFYETFRPKFIAAPVIFYDEKNKFERFQSLDFAGMMGVTGAGIQSDLVKMCNGANLAYEKNAFKAVNGFEGVDHLASGDDMFLMHKIAQRYPEGIGFIKSADAVVFTHAQKDLRSFLSQRIRWATKNTAYKDWKVTMILALVFMFCCNIILSLFLIPVFGFLLVSAFSIQLFTKSLMDYIFLSCMTKFFNRKDLMHSFFPAQVTHIFYITVVGLISLFVKKYDWKGRKVS